MNNQAFRKLVYQHSGNQFTNRDKTNTSKSNKEIARDAVQQEFNEKKRKLHGGTFDGDFDQSDDEHDYNHKNKTNGNEGDKDDDNDWEKKESQKHRKRGRRKKQKDGEDDNGNESQKDMNKYRDRAKERREGNNIDYQAAKNLSLHMDNHNSTGGHSQHDMTKFLGGDEQFTHLVKGLDRTLADKVRREEMMKKSKSGESHNFNTLSHDGNSSTRSENIDLDQIMEETKALKAKNENQLKQKHNSIKAKSSSLLASTMARYLQKMEADQSSSNVHVSSSIVNAPIMNPSLQTIMNDELNTAAKSLHCSTLNFSLLENHHNLQQYGWEIPYTSTAARNNANIVTTSCTPVDIHLITKIKSVLATINTKKKKHSDEEKKKIKKSIKLKEITKTNIKEQEHDSDDDIYGDIGDYVPPGIIARKTS